MCKEIHLLRFFKNWEKIFCKRIFSFIFASANEQKRYHSSVGRATDWKSVCPWFDSEWYHNPDQLVRVFLYLQIMNLYCYIIYSKKLNKFYIGETEDVQERLKLHISGFLLLFLYQIIWLFWVILKIELILVYLLTKN